MLAMVHDLRLQFSPNAADGDDFCIKHNAPVCTGQSQGLGCIPHNINRKPIMCLDKFDKLSVGKSLPRNFPIVSCIALK